MQFGASAPLDRLRAAADRPGAGLGRERRRKETVMRAHKVISNLPVQSIDEARDFYAGFLGPDTEEFNLG